MSGLMMFTMMMMMMVVTMSGLMLATIHWAASS